MIEIHAEEYGDEERIEEVIFKSFRNRGEVDLVNRLREEDELKLSLVAVDEEEIIGHVAFSIVTAEFNLMSRTYLGLAPLAVLPEYQKRGVGTKLVRAGLEQLIMMGASGAFVLGSPDYYQRFGFRTAETMGFYCEYNVPPGHFMAVLLRPNGFAGAGGVVSYHPLFKEVGV
jgi:putative acetyltransferase